MKAPATTKSKEIEYKGKVIQFHRVECYSLKGDRILVGNKAAKIITKPVERDVNYFTAAIQLKN